MTDQDNSTSSSEPQPAPVNEFVLADTFIRQFKKYKLGMFDAAEGVWSVREQQAIVITSIAQPEIMPAFLGRLTTLIVTAAKEEFEDPEVVLECLNDFHGAVHRLMFDMVVPFAKLSEDQKKMIQKSYLARKQQMEAETKEDSEEPSEGLLFKMPNFKPGVNPDWKD